MVIAISNLTSCLLTLFYQEMLNVTLDVVVMKATNEKKGFFLFYSHNMNKKF